MGTIRNGARSWGNVIRKACKLDKIPGWATGVDAILGPTDGPAVRAAWAVFCAVLEPIIEADNWFNQIDYQSEGDNEDFIVVE